MINLYKSIFFGASIFLAGCSDEQPNVIYSSNNNLFVPLENNKSEDRNLFDSTLRSLNEEREKEKQIYLRLINSTEDLNLREEYQRRVNLLSKLIAQDSKLIK